MKASSLPFTHRRILELDGLRGAAILLVIFWHYFVTPADFAPRTFGAYVARFGMFAWSGVDLFFVLSGFLIGGILLDSAENTAFFKTFFIRRFFRIVPLYALLCVLYAIAWLIVSGHELGELHAALPSHMPWQVYATFTQNFWMGTHTAGHTWLDVTWSLAIEEQFYLVLPFVIRFVPHRWLVWVFSTVLVFAFFARLFAFTRWGAGATSIVYFLTPFRADPLMLGALAALMTRSERLWGFLVSNGLLLKLLLTILSIILVFFIAKGWGVASAETITMGYGLLALFYVVLLLTVVTQPGSSLSWVMRTRPLMRLGTVAYGVYLLHLEVLYGSHYFFFGRKPQFAEFPEAVTTIGALGLTLVLAWLSWKCIEKPLIQLGYKIGRGERAQSDPAQTGT